MQIFNQFGICCSKDSLKRYQTSVIEKQQESGIQFQPIPSLFVDNINKRSTYESVKSRDSSRGFDGTSVQLVEHKPDSLTWHLNETGVFLQNCNVKDDQNVIIN